MEEKKEFKEPLSYRYVDIIKRELVTEGLITEDQLTEAMNEQSSTHEGIGRILVRLDLVKMEHIIDFLGRHLGIPRASLTDLKVEEELLDVVGVELSRRYRLIPLKKLDERLIVAMVDPLDISAIDAISHLTGLAVEPTMATEEELESAINELYSPTRKRKPTSTAMKTTDIDTETVGLTAPIVRLVNEIIHEAVSENASDIHLEPEETELTVRLRVDGILRKVKILAKKLELEVISRIKIMADMDIAERRVPQDGSFTLTVQERPIDLRVSTFPMAFGEKVVMRVLDRKKFLIGLEHLGFSPGMLQNFDSLIRRPHGIILVTGPTSSGKTSTLYAVLNAVRSVEQNIVTIEDPIECPIPMVRQSQVNVKAGLTFARGLRSFLRQDPDIIMVGEIRDGETAEIAMQASLTGHLVFSTLHTNDAPGALTRLVDMGIAPYLVSSSIIGVLAQRLVRRVCSKCTAPSPQDKKVITDLGFSLKDGEKATLKKGKGCPACGHTGYRGRIGIFELMMMDQEIKELVMEKTSTGALKNAAREVGMVTLREDGIEKALRGITNIDEVLRVTSEE